jgi:olefin beta-lactone synthetase
MDPSLFTRFTQTVERTPEKPVFIHPMGSAARPGGHPTWKAVSYRQFAERIDCFARGLASYGLEPGTRAALMVPPGVDLFALTLAMLKSGVVPVMVDPAIGLRNVTPCLAECQPTVYFGSPLTHAVRRIFGWGRASLRLNLTLADIARAGQRPAARPPFAPVDPQAEAAILYTSGSTGLPKGAIYSGANFAAQLEILVRALRLRFDEVDLPAFPLFALIDCLLGVTAVIPDLRFPPPARVDAARVAAAIQDQQVDTLFVSPAALTRLARHGAAHPQQLASLKKVITAGAPAPLELQEQFTRLLPPGSVLLGVYGSTEALPVALVNSCEVLEETRLLSAHGAGVCIGKPVEGMQVQILPTSDAALSLEAARPLPAGCVGEIAVLGGAVTARYVAREAANRLAKITTADGGTLHRMGDLGYFDAQGRLFFCGRKSQRVETPTQTLFTEQVEGIFNAHPLVYRTALVGVHKDGVTTPVLWVELTPAGRAADRAKIRAELRTLAQAHALDGCIQAILFHPAFPTDVRHNSKIIREKLAALAARRI